MSSFDRHLWVASIVDSHFAYLPMEAPQPDRPVHETELRMREKIPAIENAFCFGPTEIERKPVCAILPCNKRCNAIERHGPQIGQRSVRQSDCLSSSISMNLWHDPVLCRRKPSGKSRRHPQINGFSWVLQFSSLYLSL